MAREEEQAAPVTAEDLFRRPVRHDTAKIMSETDPADLCTLTSRIKGAMKGVRFSVCGFRHSTCCFTFLHQHLPARTSRAADISYATCSWTLECQRSFLTWLLFYWCYHCSQNRRSSLQLHARNTQTLLRRIFGSLRPTSTRTSATSRGCLPRSSPRGMSVLLRKYWTIPRSTLSSRSISTCTSACGLSGSTLSWYARSEPFFFLFVLRSRLSSVALSFYFLCSLKVKDLG